jgi:citrate lyase subunit beta/citryl-CoA lyase
VRAFEIASHSSVQQLAFGSADLALDLGVASEWEGLLYARSAVVAASRAAGKEAPCDGVHTALHDLEGLREAASAAKRLGYFGKSALHPRQVPVINEVFTPSSAELEWAWRIVEAFERSGGAATRLEDGEMVDLPIAERARRLLEASR